MDSQEALKADDPGLVQAAEGALRSIWCRSENAAVDQVLEEGIAAMQERDFARAVALFSRVVAEAPDFAEGYNKRATAYYRPSPSTRIWQASSSTWRPPGSASRRATGLAARRAGAG